jgi:hypothetical protein
MNNDHKQKNTKGMFYPSFVLFSCCVVPYNHFFLFYVCLPTLIFLFIFIHLSNCYYSNRFTERIVQKKARAETLISTKPPVDELAVGSLLIFKE